MPGPIRIVTDSSAHFLDPSIVKRHNITVIPLEARVGAQTYREGIDITPEAFLRRLNDVEPPPTLLPPSVGAFAQVYASLHRETDRILSVHLSRKMHSTWQNAKAATDTLLGRCEIAVVDSGSISVGLGWLVEEAAKLATQLDSLDDVVRALRRLVPQVYSVFSVERVNYLLRSGLLSQSQALLGEMLSIKPFLTIEEGELLPMEKVRTRVQSIDKLVEFVTEFAAVENLIVLSGLTHSQEPLRQLTERLATETDFGDKLDIVTQPCYPSLACFLGPDALGLMIFERDLSDEGGEAPDRDY
jgi:DegV family protein with EDD domain